MPPEIRSIENNYVFGALQRKARKLRSPLFNGLRCVILCDVGSTALRRVEEIDSLGRVYSGGQIIAEFLRQPKVGIDVVAVIAPRRERRWVGLMEEVIDWRWSVFVRPGLSIAASDILQLHKLLPPPRRDGYQTRQLHEQGYFDPAAKGRYLPMTITWKKGEKTRIKLSARALLDPLAGRKQPPQIADMLRIQANGENIFKLHLDRGETISAIKLEPGGALDDDDWIVVEFTDDPAARKLREPSISES